MQPEGSTPALAPSAPRVRLTRPTRRIIGGVCAGFAAHTGLSVRFVRVAAVVLTMCGGAGALFYAWLWATVPDEARERSVVLPKTMLTRPAPLPAGAAATEAAGAAEGGASGTGGSIGATSGIRGPVAALRSRPVPELLLGLALLGAGIALVAAQFGADVPVAVLLPGIVVLAGAGLAWWQFADAGRRSAGSRRAASSRLVRVLGALLLVTVGILLFFVTGTRTDVWTVVIAALSVVVGVGVVLSPWLLRLYRDLVEERAAREREEERAEIAAHLHDSVLQTLALIQQKAGPQSEVARLARAQERELRGWLFTGETAPELDLGEELRGIAALVENDFAVRFEVVVAGSSDRPAPDPIVAAAREAMLNAARHAGGTVTVYAETGRDALEIVVADRGPGLDLGTIPDDRYGVRESIIGRMSRAGGTASIRRGPGGTGTEVVLRIAVDQETVAPSGATTTEGRRR